MKVICINDSHKPNDVKKENWIVKDNIYTVVSTFNTFEAGKIGYVLEEISPDPPYQGYISDRFRPLEEETEKTEEHKLEVV